MHCLLPVCLSVGVLCRLAGVATVDCGQLSALSVARVYTVSVGVLCMLAGEATADCG